MKYMKDVTRNYRFSVRLLRTASDFKGLTEAIGLNSSVIPWTYKQLRVGRFRTNLLVGVSETAADTIDTNQVSRVQKVNTHKVSATHRLQSPAAIIVIGKKVRGVICVLARATRRHTGHITVI